MLQIRKPPVGHRVARDKTLLTLVQAIDDHMQRGPLSARTLGELIRKYPSVNPGQNGFYSRSQIIDGFRFFRATHSFKSSETAFCKALMRRPIRTQSGVVPVTVFTKPYPCPGECIFCPNDVRMPKSYLSNEPGCQRAEDNDFDPYLQTWGRLNVLRANGHAISKVELIILGGTFTFYAQDYQRWFIKRCFDAMNDFGAGRDNRPNPMPNRALMNNRSALPVTPAEESDGARTYNQRVRIRERELEVAALPNRCVLGELEVAHVTNETAGCRCVGLSVETRPDHVNADVLKHLRSLGVTKVQMGYQSLSDHALHINKRGHDRAAIEQATQYVRAFGFKIQAHWMPNLLGNTADSDQREYLELFENISLKPDELKVYPCMLIDDTELMQHCQRGAWRPYDDATLKGLLRHVLVSTPRYVRLSRVVRDIPSTDVVAGTRWSNMRQMVESQCQREGVRLEEIRAREIRGALCSSDTVTLKQTSYTTAGTEERFLEFVNQHDRLIGFLRLSLPNAAIEGLPTELTARALIRELHVYGATLEVAAVSQSDASQHRGYGKALVAEACRIAEERGYRGIAVIAAVGTRAYYRKLGFSLGELYMHRDLRVHTALRRHC